jgi:hypothetical protein
MAGVWSGLMSDHGPWMIVDSRGLMSDHGPWMIVSRKGLMSGQRSMDDSR